MPLQKPTDLELAEYVRSRLERIGPSFAEPQMVEEALELTRDLWLRLYELDHASDDDPASSAEAAS